MRFRKNPDLTPLCGWYYNCSDTGTTFRNHTKEELIEDIVDYREVNDLEEIPREHLSWMVEDFVCRDPLMLGRCQFHPERNLSHYYRAAKAIAKAKIIGGYVDSSIAQERLDTCINCPLNVNIPSNIAQDVVGADLRERTRKLENHHYLESCEVCTCDLKMAIWFRNPELTEDERETLEDEMVGIDGKMFKCWKVGS